MTRVLVIQSAIPTGNSVTRSLVEHATNIVSSGGSHPEIKIRDLVQTPVPHVDAAWAKAYRTMPGQEAADYKDASRISDELIEEMKWADLILLGCPMYQASIPSVLKAWIDRVLRNGHTIKMTEAGPEGLLKGRRVLSILARGGVHSAEAGGDGLDFQKPYLEVIFGLMGLERDFILCEGTGFPQLRESNVAAAQHAIASHPWLRP